MAVTTADADQSAAVTSDDDGVVVVRTTLGVQENQETVNKGRKSRQRQQRKKPAREEGTKTANNDTSHRSTYSTAGKQILHHNLMVSRVHSSAKHLTGRPVSFGYLVHPKHPVPWAQGWPEAARYYTFNLPDYTGLGLYSVGSRYPKSHMELFRDSFRSFTMQILIAERARPKARLERLMDLKGWFLRNLNEALSDPIQCASYSILSEVNALALYDLLYEDGGASTAHLHGLQLLLQRYGGAAKLVHADYDMSNVVYFTDCMHSYFNKTPRLLQQRIAGTDIMDGIHDLRLALQPTQSDLSSLRLRSHLMMSYGSPAEFVFIELADLYKLAGSVLGVAPRAVPGITSNSAITTAQQMEARIDALSERPNELCHSIYSPADRRNHQDTYELIRLSSLVLIQCFKVALCDAQDKTMKAHLDHAVQALFIHLLDGDTSIRSTEALCWAMLVGVPFLDQAGILRKHTTTLVSGMLKKLHLNTWTSTRAFLEDIFFSAPLQEEACRVLWDEMQPGATED